jgi:hypothetical protein
VQSNPPNNLLMVHLNDAPIVDERSLPFPIFRSRFKPWKTLAMVVAVFGYKLWHTYVSVALVRKRKRQNERRARQSLFLVTNYENYENYENYGVHRVVSTSHL